MGFGEIKSKQPSCFLMLVSEKFYQDPDHPESNNMLEKHCWHCFVSCAMKAHGLDGTVFMGNGITQRKGWLTDGTADISLVAASQQPPP